MQSVKWFDTCNIEVDFKAAQTRELLDNYSPFKLALKGKIYMLEIASATTVRVCEFTWGLNAGRRGFDDLDDICADNF
jgi:hypothetical protein